MNTNKVIYNLMILLLCEKPKKSQNSVQLPVMSNILILTVNFNGSYHPTRILKQVFFSIVLPDIFYGVSKKN
jgi:hypothetical protein